jgi:hypothetical protein
MMITMSRRRYPSLTDAPITYPCLGSSSQVQRQELDDVRVLRPERRTFGDVSTWAWDTHDELVGLLCLSCGDVSDGHGDETCDNDICGHCGSEDTQRVITDADDHVLRGA